MPDIAGGGPVQAQIVARRVFFAGRQRAELDYLVAGSAPQRVRVDLVSQRSGALVASWNEGTVTPQVERSVAWNGRSHGRAQPDGRYQFRVYIGAAASAPAGSASAAQSSPTVAEGFSLLGHIFPVRGPHSYGTAADRFGAARAGHTHQGQDVLARCGTPLVAARGGVVHYKAFHSAAGNYVVIDTAGSGIDEMYAHLRAPALVSVGAHVYTGQRIGFVGDTGDAQGCHLHFERWTAPGWYEGGHPFDPLPSLRAWDRVS